MKKWIGILVALSLVLAFSMPAYAQQKAKPAPMSKEEADKMMEECTKMMETSMAKMKEMHEKMRKGEMQVDAAKMKKLRNSIFAIDKDLDEIQKKGF
jgi:phosphotransacetylase